MTLALLGLVTQTFHQGRKLFQRHAGNRQHVGFRLEPATRIFGSQHVRQPFQHVDPDRTLARIAVTGHGVGALGAIRHGGDRDQTGGRRFGELGQPLGKRPQNQTQARRRRFQQEGHKNSELAKADAVLAQRAARILIEGLDLVRDGGTGQNAQCLDHAKGKSLGQTAQRFVTLHGDQRLEQGRNLAIDEMLQAALDLLCDIRACHIIDKHLDLRLERIGPCNQFAHRRRAPHQAALFGVVNLCIGRVVKPIRAQMKMRGKRLKGRRLDCLGFGCTGPLVLTEPEPVQLADELALDSHFTCVIYFGHHGLLLA